MSKLHRKKYEIAVIIHKFELFAPYTIRLGMNEEYINSSRLNIPNLRRLRLRS